MIKSVGKRFLSIALVIMMVFSLLPVIQMSASAANVNTGVTGLTADSSGNATWTTSGGAITGAATTTSSTSCGSTSYSAKTGTLTFTNSSGALGLLSFDYSVELNGGSATVDGAEATGGAFSKTLANGETLAISITSNSAAENTTKIVISNLKLTAETNVTITFTPGVNGTYTVNGMAVTASTPMSFKTTDSVALAATAKSGYKFLGWYNAGTGTCLSTAASGNLSFTEDATIEPRFIQSSVPLFQVGTNIFSDLNSAVAYAQQTGIEKIILISNGTLPAGDYTIPNGKTLLIPMDAAYTVVKDTPSIVYDSHATPTAFSLLTMASGANITVASGGAISLASKLSSKGQLAGWNGTPTGPDGRINMASGSSITVQSGGNLYAWGYIYGSGSVVAQSGATVHEAFQIKDWRGGSATSSCYNYTFIINQYYVQNIEVPLTLHAGATEKLYSAANASGSAYPMGVTFIGSNAGMFRINSGYLVKDYIEGTDRLQVDCYGDVSLSSMSMTGLPLVGSVDTESYDLPITSNITINIHEGTASIGQDIKLLPSAEINIDNGGEMNIASGKNVYLYDLDNWGNYTGSAKLYVIGYSVANGTKTMRTAAGLTDAKLDVNGTVNVSGKLYTSVGGANITSSDGTGKVVLATAPGASNATIYEMANNKDKTAVTFNPAKLHNGANRPADKDEYTATAGSDANTTFSYCSTHDMWERGDGYTVSFNANDGEGSMENLTTCPAGSVTLTANTFTRSGYAFKGWNTAADGSGTAYADKDEITVAADTTLYAQWEQLYTVTWQNADGTVLETDVNVAAGTMPKYNGATPTKADDTTAKVRYVFNGWDKTLAPVTGDVTYTAKYDEAPLYYKVELYYDDAAAPVYTKAETLYKNSLKLTAEDPREDGKHFSHWSIQYFDKDGAAIGEPVEYNAKQITIHPGVGGITVQARAIYSDTETTFGPFVKIIGAEFNKFTNKWTFTLTQSVPSGVAEEVGFVLSVDSTEITVPSTMQRATNTFTAHVSMDGWEGKPLYVRAYLTYNGTTYYSDDPALVYRFPTE